MSRLWGLWTSLDAAIFESADLQKSADKGVHEFVRFWFAEVFSESKE